MDTKKQTPEEAPALSEAEMKAIGEISIGPSKHEVFLNNHYKKLIWGCVALGLLGGGAIAWFSYRHTTDQDAAAALVGAMNAQHALTDLNPADFNGEGLRSITESSRYGKTPSAGTARLLEGLRLIATGQQDAGIKALEPIAADSSRPELAARAHAQLASLYMQQENDEKAAAHWKAILDLGPTAYSAFACMSLGDIARAAGKKDEAKSWYERAVKDYTNSDLVRISQGALYEGENQALASLLSIDFRMKLLDTDPPMPVSPAPAPAPATGAEASGSSLLQGGSPLDAGSSLPGGTGTAGSSSPLDVTGGSAPATDTTN